MSLAEIFKATQLTRGGRLMDATRLIQKALGLAKSPSAPGGPAERAGADARADTRSGSHPAARDAARSGDDDVVDAPFREVLRKPANEAVFSPHEVPEGPEVQGAPDVAARQGEPPVEPSKAKLAPASPARPASFTESTFRSGASTYAYRLYVPGSDGEAMPADAVAGTQADTKLLPLVVLLHGCKQDAADFAAGTAMNALAEAEKCLVLYPEQLSSANPMRCWNWFDAAHQARDTGEPHMIATLIQHILATHPADPSRVYIAGLSAGGAMAALMAGLYPELIAAVGVHSGLPAGAASDVVSAFSAMRRGARPNGTTGGTAGGTAEGDADGDAVVMPTIVFHGSADKTVNPDNGDQIIDAALAALGSAGITLQKVEQLADSPEGRDPGAASQRDTLRTVYSAAGGKSYVEHWAVDAGPHAWSGGDAAGSFTDPHGPSASEAMLAFFLQHQRAN